jgi:hypothetical protein
MLKQLNIKTIIMFDDRCSQIRNVFTDRLFYLREKVVSMCILPNLGTKIGSQSLATKFISL